LEKETTLMPPDNPGAIQEVELLNVSFARSDITDFTLFHQAISTDESYYQSYFHKIMPKYFSCLSEAPITEYSCPNLFCGKISECFRKNLRSGSYDFYLCGEREMIREVTLLIDEIYPESRVYTEVFYYSGFRPTSN